MGNEELARALARRLAGGVRTGAPVQQQPRSVLTELQVYELGDGAWHLVDGGEDADEGRATSVVVDVDAKGRACRTVSGRVDPLRGPPWHNGDAAYVWWRWCQVNGVRGGRELTGEVAAVLGRSGA